MRSLQRSNSLWWLLSVVVAVVLFSSGSALGEPLCSDRINVWESTLDSEIGALEWVHKDKNDPSASSLEAIFAVSWKGTVYRSVDGGKQLERQTQITDTISRIYLTASSKQIYFVGRDPRSLWVTNDQGESYKSRFLPTRIWSLMPHPKKADWALAIGDTAACSDFTSAEPCYNILYMTKDFGSTWKPIARYVQQAEWARPSGDTKSTASDETVFIVTWRSPTGDQRGLDMTQCIFQRSNDLFNSVEYSLDHVIAFLLFQDDIFIAKMEKGSTGLSLARSLDDGDTFLDILFPKGEFLAENRYTILEASNETTFINVDHSRDKSWGITYSANADKTKFTEALRYHKRLPSGPVDFGRVSGLEGIYIANKYDVQNPETIYDGSNAPLKTFITYDKGAEWRQLTAPEKDVNGKPWDCSGDCHLHLVGRTASTFGQFYTNENALGLIFANGNVGPYLDTLEMSTFFSRDAGLTWREIAKGPHTYEFADHGALSIYVDNKDASDIVHYSWNEGLHWETCRITDLGSIDITNVATEPSNTGLAFLVYGERNGKGVVIHLDFSKLHERSCTNDDYELWSPSENTGDECLLGQKFTYKRRKQDAECFVPDDLERPVFVTQCQCKREDYECDYCYTRNDKDECVLSCPDYEQLPPSPCNDYWLKTKGYQRVPGDKCMASPQVPESMKWEPERASCDGSGGSGSGKKGMSGGAIFGVLVLVLFVVVTAALITTVILVRKNDAVREALKDHVPNFVLPPEYRASQGRGAAQRGGGSRPRGSAYSRLEGNDTNALLHDMDEDEEEDDLLDRGAEELDDKDISSFANQGSSSSSSSSSSSKKRQEAASSDEGEEDFNPRSENESLV